MERLLLVAAGVLILLLSIPLHEFCHLVCIWLLGDRRSRKVEWFRITKSGLLGVEFGGAVYIEDGVKLSKFFKEFGEKHIKAIGFAIGFSGGLGAAFLLGMIGLFLHTVDVGIWKLFAIVASFQLLYGIIEGVTVAKVSMGYEEIPEEVTWRRRSQLSQSFLRLLRRLVEEDQKKPKQDRNLASKSPSGLAGAGEALLRVKPRRARNEQLGHPEQPPTVGM